MEPPKPAHTLCNKMWDAVFVTVDGDVFFCCRQQPERIGNLYHESLEEMWNGPKARDIREQSLGGMLRCHATCNMLTREEKAMSPEGWGNTAPFIRKVHIEHHEFCNSGCVMGYQLKIKNRKHLPNDLLCEQIDFTKVGEVQLQGGEPLVYKPCVRFFHRLTDEFKVPVTLMTNALLITEALADKIAATSLEIMIAMNAATKEIHELVNERSHFDRVLESIAMLQAAKRRHRSRLRVEGHITLIRENVHELPDFIELVERLNLDSISISWEESVPDYLASRPDLYHTISRRLTDMELGARKVFVKKKHLQRIETLFDVGSEEPQLRSELLPSLEQTGFYRGLWKDDPRASDTELV